MTPEDWLAELDERATSLIERSSHWATPVGAIRQGLISHPTSVTRAIPALRSSLSASAAVRSSTSQQSARLSSAAMSGTVRGHGERASRESKGHESAIALVGGVSESEGMGDVAASGIPDVGPSDRPQLRCECRQAHARSRVDVRRWVSAVIVIAVSLAAMWAVSG